MAAADRRRRPDPLLLLICTGGLVARLVVALYLPNRVHPDETFQYLEQAYRVVSGHGIVPWEFTVGARSWLIPGLLIPLVAIGRAVSPAALLVTVALVSSLVSLVVIVAAHAIGRRAGGRQAGLFAALLTAFWCEIVYFSPHILADTLAVPPLMAAIAVGYRRHSRNAQTLLMVGVLLGLTVEIRPQLAPAATVAAIGLVASLDWRRYLPLLAGGAGVVLLFGLLDWVTWGTPFASTITYVRANSGGVAALFGIQRQAFYAIAERMVWGWMELPILVTFYFGARRMPLIAILTAVILATFSAVGHKEFRFIYPALPLLFTVCGVGSAALVDGATARWPGLGRHRAAGWSIAAAVLWLSGSLIVAGRPMMHDRFTSESGPIVAMVAIDREGSACGVGVDAASEWWQTGTVHLRDDIGLYQIMAAPLVQQRSFNRILAFPEAERGADYAAAGYRLDHCFEGNPRVCVYQRPGTCHPSNGARLLQPGEPPEITVALRRLGIPHLR